MESFIYVEFQLRLSFEIFLHVSQISSEIYTKYYIAKRPSGAH